MTRIPDMEVQRETAKAILVTDGNDSFWVPKSVITDDSDVWELSEDGAGPGDLVVEDWWAEKEGLS
jgi:hypothetical protein